MKQENLRNVAIIAHVDHGKTTLVDALLRQSGVYRTGQAVVERVMDSNDLERERGITILAKNTAVRYGDVKINIIDTPGHADFGGEVERILKMAGGVLVLVDAAEGPMPQTRFVMSRALELDLPLVIVINKIDRPDARLDEVADEVLELLIDLDAPEQYLDSPVIYCTARDGRASLASVVNDGDDLTPLFEAIIGHIPPPEGEKNAPLQILTSSIDYNEYVGRIGIGRIERGVCTVGGEVMVVSSVDDARKIKSKLVSLYEFDGLKRVPIQSAEVGDIVAFSGIEDITIGDTVTAIEAPDALPFVNISEPTVEMTFSVNDSPFAGREGKFVTSRNLRDRLFRELLKDVSLRVSEVSSDSFAVAGRGEMHLSILIENMRREGYEFQVGAPRVLFKEENGAKMEPIEAVLCDIPEASVGAVMEKLGSRKGELVKMTPSGSRMRVEFLVPARGLFGYRNEFLTDTRGEGILSTVFHGYAPFKGDIARRQSGSLVAFESGEAVAYGLHQAQERGLLFITPGTPVYAGMVVGMSPKAGDITVNICKRKQLTNTRASGSDDSLRLITPRNMSLEQCIEYISDDELLEITPENVRIRKRELDHAMRMRALKKGEA